MATLVTRPIVRQFQARFGREIRAHVGAGGHAVVWESPSRARLVLPVPKKGDDHDLALWSLLDLGKSRWKVIPRGNLRGFATILVPRDCFEVVRHRAERDSVFPGSTRTIELDCLACGACCRDNVVNLEEVDVERFREGGRPDLAKPPFTKRSDGKLVLKLLKSKDCQHLMSDNKCAIYTLRPDACSMFPAGSECCLFSREEELGIVDGLDDGKAAKIAAKRAEKRRQRMEAAASA
jgi:Fe-S-cluster containining protein